MKMTIMKFVMALHKIAPIKQAHVQKPQGTEFTKNGSKPRRGTEILLLLHKPRNDAATLLHRAAAKVSKQGASAKWRKTSPLGLKIHLAYGELKLGKKTVNTFHYTMSGNTWIVLHLNEDLSGRKNRNVTEAQALRFIQRARKEVPLH